MRTPLRLAAVLGTAAACAMALASCGSSASSTTSASSPASASRQASSAGGTASTPSATATAAAFPVTVTAGNGVVTVKRDPTRIVSLSATTTEDLYGVGAGSQVVAVDQDSDYPAGVPKTTLSGLTPNIEAIAKYRPSLVVAWQNTGGL